MNEQYGTLSNLCLSLILVLMMSGGVLAEETSESAEAAKSEAPEAVKSEATWVLSEAGKAVGKERMKRVLSSKKKRYTSIEVLYDKESKRARVTSFQERDADNTLRKYFRKKDVRLGKGVRAFRRGVGIRIVGVNQKMEPVEIPKASEHHVWDPTMLSGLALWLELASRANEVSFKVLDIAQRASVTARLVPEGTATLGDPEGQAAQVNCWKAWAGGAEVATMCGDGAGTLVSVKAGRRALLLDAWTWKVPEPKPSEPDNANEDASASTQGDAKETETGVGP